jgi:hypothetical protein
MARQLLLKTLVSVLGDFVDGLTEDNLKVGVSRDVHGRVGLELILFRGEEIVLLSP